MTEEKFNNIKKHIEILDRVKWNIASINSLIASQNLYCTINGTPSEKFKKEYEYRFSDESVIKNFLMGEKLKLEIKLSELENEFSLM